MRWIAVVSLSTLVILVTAIAQPAAADPTSPSVIQFWYTWGTSKIGSAEVWTFGATNLTMNLEVSEQNRTRVEEITEFHVHAVAPGRDPYPPANGTNPFPYPQISAIYDTLQVIRDPDHCVASNNSVGFECGVPLSGWQHQVLEIRFLRLVEFTDTNGNGGYDAGEPILSQLDLGDPALQYAAVYLDGLNATTGFQALPFRNHYPDVCCGESWDGWIGQNESLFKYFDGLIFRLSATGPANVTITGYQWFRPKVFQGTNLTPFQAKLDLTVEAYPFADVGSRLAMELNFTSFSQGSSTSWQVIPWPEGQALGVDATNTTAILAWSSHATADGAPVSVVGTVVPADAFSRHVYFSYPRAGRIQHDPVFGITDKRLTSEVTNVPPPFSLNGAWIAFIATLVAASATIYAVEHRKR